MVTDIQKDPDYTDAVNFLLDLLAKYTQKAKETVQNASEEAQQAEPNTHLEKAMDLGQQILTNYAGGHDLSGITRALQSLLQEIENDDTLKEYFHDVNRFIQRALKEEGFVMTDKADHEAHELYDRGRELTTNNDKYKEAVEQVGDEFQALFDAISSDRGNRRVLLAGKKVFDDLTTEEGRFDVWRDFGAPPSPLLDETDYSRRGHSKGRLLNSIYPHPKDRISRRRHRPRHRKPGIRIRQLFAQQNSYRYQFPCRVYQRIYLRVGI